MKHKENLKRYFENAIIIFLTVAFCFSMLEIGLRMLSRTPSNMTDGIFEQWGNSYRLKKNVSKVTQWPSYSYTTYTNSFGFRDKRSGKHKISEKPYFVFLGDSQTFGNGVNYEDSFVGVFARLALTNGVDVLNLGVGGHHLSDQMSQFDEFCQKVSKTPSKSFLCLDAISIFSFDKQYENILVRNGYLFDRRAWKIAYIKMMFSNISSAYCFFRDNIRKAEAKWLNLKVGDAPPYLKVYSKDNRMHNSAVIKELENKLTQFEKYCDKIGTIPVYVFLPLVDSYALNELAVSLGENPKDYDTLFYENFIKEYCRRRKVQLINLRPILKSYYEGGHQLRFKIDAHYNKFTNRIVGDYIYSQMFPGGK